MQTACDTGYRCCLQCAAGRCCAAAKRWAHCRAACLHAESRTITDRRSVSYSQQASAAVRLTRNWATLADSCECRNLCEQRAPTTCGMVRARAVWTEAGNAELCTSMSRSMDWTFWKHWGSRKGGLIESAAGAWPRRHTALEVHCCRHLLLSNTSTQSEPTVYPSSIRSDSVQRADIHQRHIMASTSGSSLPACLVLPARQSCRCLRPFSSSSDASRSAMQHRTASRVVRCECTSLCCVQHASLAMCLWSERQHAVRQVGHIAGVIGHYASPEPE